MDEIVNRIISAYARGRVFKYANCVQATFGTMSGYLGVTERTAMKASCPLDAGGVSWGSTCGVVTGGCLSIVLAHMADALLENGAKGEALYGRLREYTSWFEREFGSTLCRERSGVEVSEIAGRSRYVFTGKAVNRCLQHIGAAVTSLIAFANRPLDDGVEVGLVDRRLASSGGYCAAEVMRGVRAGTGYGSLFLEQLSLALDGGIGLSGGLCGALAGALLPLGLVWGIDPREESVAGTFIPTLRGYVNICMHRREPELWSLADNLMHEFQDRYGSLECGDIVKRSFDGGRDLAEFVTGSSLCAGIKEWCARRACELISENTRFS
jgi:hypothetical protein